MATIWCLLWSIPPARPAGSLLGFPGLRIVTINNETVLRINTKLNNVSNVSDCDYNHTNFKKVNEEITVKFS